MKTPLIQEPKQTNRLWLILPLVLIVGLIGAWNADILPTESKEIPLGVVDSVEMEATAILDAAKGPLTAYKASVGTVEWHKLWMYATASGYCWSSTAFNALRLIAKPAFDAGLAAPESTTAGFIRKGANITPQMRYFIARMAGASPKASTREICDAEVWQRNTFGDANMMGIAHSDTKECYGYSVSKDAISQISSAPPIGIDGGKCQANWVSTIKTKLDAGSALVAAVSFEETKKFVHYLTFGGYFTKGSTDWFLILNPTNSPATREVGKAYKANTDDKLYPWAVYKLQAVGGDTKYSGRIKIIGADNQPKYWICFLSWISPEGRTRIPAEFDLVKPR